MVIPFREPPSAKPLIYTPGGWQVVPERSMILNFRQRNADQWDRVRVSPDEYMHIIRTGEFNAMRFACIQVFGSCLIYDFMLRAAGRNPWRV